MNLRLRRTLPQTQRTEGSRSTDVGNVGPDSRGVSGIALLAKLDATKTFELARGSGALPAFQAIIMRSDDLPGTTALQPRIGPDLAHICVCLGPVFADGMFPRNLSDTLPLLDELLFYDVQLYFVIPA